MHRKSSAGIQPLKLVGQGIAPTLLECWLLRALLVLSYRVLPMLIPTQNWDRPEAPPNRRAFRDLWCWTAGLGALQAGALHMHRITMEVH